MSETFEVPQFVLSYDLAGQDENFELLNALFEELQLCSAEAANPEFDLVLFARSCLHFYVINEKITSANTSTAETSSANSFTWVGKALGFCYLMPSQKHADMFHIGELSAGIILTKKAREKGIAKEAVASLVDLAFENHDVHRVQAIIIDGPGKERPMSLFAKLAFRYEGTLFRSFCCPFTGTWKDATYMAILATDYVTRIRDRFSSAPHTLWDELLSRQQKEREELIFWGDRKLKRKASCDTIVPADSDSESMATESVASSHSPKKMKEEKSTTSELFSPHDDADTGYSTISDEAAASVVASGTHAAYQRIRENQLELFGFPTSSSLSRSSPIVPSSAPSTGQSPWSVIEDLPAPSEDSEVWSISGSEYIEG